MDENVEIVLNGIQGHPIALCDLYPPHTCCKDLTKVKIKETKLQPAKGGQGQP
jgi:hypothetical protein